MKVLWYAAGVVFVIFVLALPSLTLAAAKSNTESTHHAVYSVNSLSGTFCGVTGVFIASETAGSYSFTAWDNGRWVLQESGDRITLSTLSGAVVATQIGHSEFIAGYGGLPVSHTSTESAVCSSSTPDPGAVVWLQETLKVNANGTTVELFA